MASIAIRRTLINLLDCIRCFFLRGIETSAWIPLSFYTDQRYGVFPKKGIIEKQAKDWNGLQVQTKTAKMLLNITQTVQEMQKTATTVALITASLTTPVGSMFLTAPTPSKTAMDNKAIDTAKCPSLPEISCSFIDSTPTYCYFIVNSANNCIQKSIARAFGAKKLRKMKTDTNLDVGNDSNNNSFNEDDDDDGDDITSTIEFSNMMLPRQRTCSESSDDNFICFVDDDLDCKASSGSSKNYGYYSNQYDSETDYSSVDSCDEDDEEDEEEEEDEDCVMPIEKKVRFDPKPTVHVMRTWNFAYRSARKGDWENAARDRVRFQTRIQRAAAYLNPILEKEHRQKIYQDRFAPDTEKIVIY